LAGGRPPLVGAPGKKGEAPAPLRRAVLGAVGLIGVCLLLRCVLWPLTGYDNHWRWDFLARRVLELGRFDYYPPRAPQDFATYFYVDAIPPLVPFTYWWLYAAAGRNVAELTALPVIAQYALTAWLTYRTGAVLFSKRAGLLGVAALATSLLFYRAVAIGRETGLTALSMIALTYFIVSAGEGADYRAMVLAGLSAAVGALAREYGWSFLAYGLVTLWWRKRGWKEMLVFSLTACAVAGPWYLRTLLLTGNPLYSNRLLGLPDNPVHAAIMDFYREQIGVGGWPASRWLDLRSYLVRYAPLQLLLGPPAALAFARRHGYLGLGALLVAGLYLSSIGYTSGGEFYAARVLAPAVVLLSLLAGALLDRLRWRAAQAVAGLLLAALLVRANAYALIYPATLSAEPRFWPQLALRREPNALLPVFGEEKLPGLLAGRLPPGTRLLAENACAFAALAGTDYEVVPVWSPEVSFLFDKALDPRTICRRLEEHNIRAVVYNPVSLSTHYLQRASPFYAGAPRGWKLIVELEGTKTVIYELPAPEPAIEHG
jgi:hypothetical protein